MPLEEEDDMGDIGKIVEATDELAEPVVVPAEAYISEEYARAERDRERCNAAIEQLIADPKAVDEWFICGPGPMMDVVETFLLQRGVPVGRIHSERFDIV